MNPKQLAAEKAVSFLEDGMTIGLGTGSTAYWAIEKIGERVRKENWKIKAIATSVVQKNRHEAWAFLYLIFPCNQINRRNN